MSAAVGDVLAAGDPEPEVGTVVVRAYSSNPVPDVFIRGHADPSLDDRWRDAWGGGLRPRFITWADVTQGGPVTVIHVPPGS